MRLLIPTDFSIQAHFAWLMTLKLGEKLNNEITFLHIIDLPGDVIIGKDGKPMSDGESDVSMYLRMHDVAQEKFEDLRKQYQHDFKTIIQYGHITDTICKTAENGNFDMVVMGTRGAVGLQEALSGSETQHVVRHCKIPVLSLMCDRSELQIRNILLVHDFSDTQKQELKLLREIQQAFGSKIHLLRVLDTDNADVADAYKKSMDNFIKQHELSNADIHILKDSDVEAGVTHFTQMKEMDLLCIGTHGRSGIRQMLSPSIAEKLVNHLFKPIITYHIH